MSFVKRFLIGILVGIGGITPGASGGAIAMVAGIYQKMIDSISGILKSFKKNLLFLIPIGLGAGVGIVLFSNVQKFLIERYPIPTMFGFAGLVIGTIPALFRKANKENNRTSKSIIAFCVTLLISLIICYFEYKLDNGGINVSRKCFIS